MWKLILTIIGFILATLTYANDDDFFTDFEEIPLEVDENFLDDFADIESNVSIKRNTASSKTITTHELFAEEDLLRRETSISIFGGNETIASTYHLSVFPQGKFELGPVFGHFGVPLRFPVYDNTSSSRGIRHRGFVAGKTFIRPRLHDYQSFFDAQKIVRHFSINHSDDAYFLRFSRSHSVTMGQGELIKFMSPDGLYDLDALFLQGHAAFKYFRLDGFIGPLLKAQIAALSINTTPLLNINAPAFVQNLNFFATYVNDFFAPNQPVKEKNHFVLSDDARTLKRAEGMAQGFSLGVDGQYSPVWWLSLKPYFSYSHLVLSGIKQQNNKKPVSYGAGINLGNDLAINFLAEPRRSSLVLKTEGRLFSKNYFPSYFGSTYLIDRLVFNEPGSNSEPLTKSQFVADGGDRRFRFGYLCELSYAYEKMLSMMLGYENAHSFARAKSIQPMRKLYFTTSFLGIERVQFHIGYQATSMSNVKELFDFKKSRALLSLKGQVKLLPFLYFDAWAKHSFGIHDMFSAEVGENEPIWLSSFPETRSLNFGLGLELAMAF